MPYEKLRTIRPLTRAMLEMLKDCFERQNQKEQAGEYYDPIAAKGLVDRGLIANNNKVTSLGKEYMQHYFGK